MWRSKPAWLGECAAIIFSVLSESETMCSLDGQLSYSDQMLNLCTRRSNSSHLVPGEVALSALGTERVVTTLIVDLAWRRKSFIANRFVFNLCEFRNASSMLLLASRRCTRVVTVSLVAKFSPNLQRVVRYLLEHLNSEVLNLIEQSYIRQSVYSSLTCGTIWILVPYISAQSCPLV